MLYSRLSNKSLLYKIKEKLIFWPYIHRTCTFPFLSRNTLHKHDVWTNVEVNGWTFILLIWSSLMNRHHYPIYLLLVKMTEDTYPFSFSSEEKVTQRVACTVTGARGTATNAIYWPRDYRYIWSPSILTLKWKKRNYW